MKKLSVFGLNNKKIIVAGGRGLIGRAVCAKLRDCGADVSIADPEFRPVYDWLQKDYYQGFVNCSYPRTNHLRAFTEATEVLADHMASHRGGAIVNLASIYGVIGANYKLYENTSMDMPVEYSAVKGGTIAFSRCMATKYGKDKVRINCVSPGGVCNGQADKFISRYNESTPLGRMATPDDIAWPVVFLLSDLARYITGENLIVDGGKCAW